MGCRCESYYGYICEECAEQSSKSGDTVARMAYVCGNCLTDAERELLPMYTDAGKCHRCGIVGPTIRDLNREPLYFYWLRPQPHTPLDQEHDSSDDSEDHRDP